MAAKKSHSKRYNRGKHIKGGNLGDDAGACLTGHVGTYKKKNTCSYRWQSLEESKSSRKSIYNKDPKKVPQSIVDEREARHKNKNVGKNELATSAYWTKKRKRYPGDYSFKIALPANKGDWYVGGPSADKSLKKVSGRGYVPKGRNFEHMLWPYWNNAHHIIPKGTLNGMIDEDKIVPEARAKSLIRSALLKAKYNVNHHKNVILLPMDKEVAAILKLPRHLVLEDETTVVEATPKFDHVGYNKQVEGKLKKIIKDYNQACDEQLAKKCVEPNFQLSKARLVNLSKTLYDAIVALGKSEPGRPISEITL